MIQIQKYSIDNGILTNKLLITYINQFWLDIFSKVKGDKHLWLMCKVHYSEEELGHKTLGQLRRVNFDDKELFLEYLSERLGILNDAYTSLAISEISFSYVINEGLATDNDRLQLQDLSDKTTTTHRFNNYNIPTSMNPSDYGSILATTTFSTFTRFIVNAGTRNYQIDSNLESMVNKVTILGASNFKWTDTKLSVGFKREIGKSTIYFLDGEIVLRKQQLSAKSFSKVSKDSKLKQNKIL